MNNNGWLSRVRSASHRSLSLFSLLFSFVRLRRSSHLPPISNSLLYSLSTFFASFPRFFSFSSSLRRDDDWTIRARDDDDDGYEELSFSSSS